MGGSRCARRANAKSRGRQEAQKKADAAPEAKKVSEPAGAEPARLEPTRPGATVAGPGAAPGPATEPPRPEPAILRGTDASGLPVLTDDPNLLRRR